jgi:Sulfotransferase family
VQGEKSPSYCAHLPRIAARFPEARFLIIQRDFAEVYRSVLDAAREVRWWGRPGAFHRLLREQETMQRDVRRLCERGVPVRCVRYRELVDRTEPVMRGVAEFLGVEFTPTLATLHGADLTAVHRSPEHAHLQRREIGQRSNPVTIPARRARCIARFQARWDALEGRTRPEASDVAPVGRLEFFVHQTLGEIVVQFRHLVRRIYEIAPPPALRAYRELKRDLRELPHQLGATRKGTLLRHVCLQIAIIAAILGTCAVANAVAGPEVTMAPFYLLPVAYAVRRFNVACGLLVSLVTAVVWSSVHLSGDTIPEQAGLLAWNSAMRFVVFALFTLLAGSGADRASIPADSRPG